LGFLPLPEQEQSRPLNIFLLDHAISFFSISDIGAKPFRKKKIWSKNGSECWNDEYHAGFYFYNLRIQLLVRASAKKIKHSCFIIKLFDYEYNTVAAKAYQVTALWLYALPCKSGDT
jgi:hypothetical protein